MLVFGKAGNITLVLNNGRLRGQGWRQILPQNYRIH